MHMNLRSKHRMTNQRRVIVEILRDSKAHPTVQELYQQARAHIPKISLATVYRNLDFLVRPGQVRNIDPGRGQWRFDGDLERHYHIRCVSCERIDDIVDFDASEFNSEALTRTDYRILSHRLEFIGICPDCRKKGHFEELYENIGGEL